MRIDLDLDDLGSLATPEGTVRGEDVVMESASNRELTKALHDLVVKLPVPRGDAERVIDMAKAKIDAATSDSAIVTAFPREYRANVREYIRAYRTEVEVLASCRSILSELHKHRFAKTFPVSLSSIKVPSIQFTQAFTNAPALEGDRGRYMAASGTVAFEPYLSSAVQALKIEILQNWILEKEREVTFLERKASAAEVISRLEGVVSAKHTQLKARHDYLVGRDLYPEIIRDVELGGVVSHALATTAIVRVNSLVLAEEDEKLETAIKKMTLEKPALDAGAQASTNDLLELKKLISDLTKKVNLQNKKVCDNPYALLCACTGHLSLTPPLLESLLIDLVKFG